MHPMPVQHMAVVHSVCLLASPLVILTVIFLLAGPLATLLKFAVPLYAQISVEFVSGSASCCPPDTDVGTSASVEQNCAEPAIPATGCSGGSFFFVGTAGGHPFVQTHSVTALVPLCYATMLGVVVPCLLFLLAQYQIWRGEIRLEEEFLGRPWKQKRRRWNVIQSLADFTHVVREGDYVLRQKDCSGGGGDGGCAGEASERKFRSKSCSLLLPKPGCPSSEKCPATREIPNECAICLSNYELGDSIVWSSNKDCRHAFHESCCLPWLVRRRKCPLCRQTFVGPD